MTACCSYIDTFHAFMVRYRFRKFAFKACSVLVVHYESCMSKFTPYPRPRKLQLGSYSALYVLCASAVNRYVGPSTSPLVFG